MNETSSDDSDASNNGRPVFVTRLDEDMNWPLVLRFFQCTPIVEPPIDQRTIDADNTVAPPRGLVDRYAVCAPAKEALKAADDLRRVVGQQAVLVRHKRINPAVASQHLIDANAYAMALRGLNAMLGTDRYTIAPGQHVFWQCSNFTKSDMPAVPLSAAAATDAPPAAAVAAETRVSKSLFVNALDLLDEERFAWFTVAELAVHILLSAMTDACTLGSKLDRDIVSGSLDVCTKACQYLSEPCLWKNVPHAINARTVAFGEYHRETVVFYALLASAVFDVVWPSVGNRHEALCLGQWRSAHSLFVATEALSESPGGYGRLRYSPAGLVVAVARHCIGARLFFTAAHVCLQVARGHLAHNRDYDNAVRLIRYACSCLTASALQWGFAMIAVNPKLLKQFRMYFIRLLPVVEEIENLWNTVVTFCRDETGADDPAVLASLQWRVHMKMACFDTAVAVGVAEACAHDPLTDFSDYSGIKFVSAQM